MALENGRQSTNSKVIIQSHNGGSVNSHQLRSGASQSSSAPPSYDLSIILQRSKEKCAPCSEDNWAERGSRYSLILPSRSGPIIHTRTERNPRVMLGPNPEPHISSEQNESADIRRLTWKKGISSLWTCDDVLFCRQNCGLKQMRLNTLHLLLLLLFFYITVHKGLRCSVDFHSVYSSVTKGEINIGIFSPHSKGIVWWYLCRHFLDASLISR